MSLPPRTPEPARDAPPRWRRWSGKAIALIAATVVLGWVFAWAQSKSYEPNRTAGFWMGLVHGAVMPAALPCLLVGKDVPIFAPNNTGRAYKLGYVFGINCSGIVFFGLSFRPSNGKPGARERSEPAV